MKTFKIPVLWRSFGYYEVEANTKEEALKEVSTQCLPIGEYLDDSLIVIEDEIEELN